jgi:hypothetical protein
LNSEIVKKLFKTQNQFKIPMTITLNTSLIMNSLKNTLYNVISGAKLA